MSKPTCSTKGCGCPTKARGLCNAHYLRWRRYGDPSAGGVRRLGDPTAVIASRTEWVGECLTWTASHNGYGYGRMKINGRDTLVHRWVWEQANGQIPPGVEIDHVCHNRACVKREHLRATSKSENMQNRRGAAITNVNSGHRNVESHKGGYSVRLKLNGERFYFGSYKTLDEAVRVAEAERSRLFGDFAGGSLPALKSS